MPKFLTECPICNIPFVNKTIEKQQTGTLELKTIIIGLAPYCKCTYEFKNGIAIEVK